MIGALWYFSTHGSLAAVAATLFELWSACTLRVTVRSVRIPLSLPAGAGVVIRLPGYECWPDRHIIPTPLRPCVLLRLAIRGLHGTDTIDLLAVRGLVPVVVRSAIAVVSTTIAVVVVPIVMLGEHHLGSNNCDGDEEKYETEQVPHGNSFRVIAPRRNCRAVEILQHKIYKSSFMLQM